MTFRKRPLGVTLGDPAGIGAEIILKALSQPTIRRAAPYILFGHRQHLERVQRRFHLRPLPRDMPIVEPVGAFPATFPLGRPGRPTGRAALAYLETALTWAQHGWIRALVTAPVNKAAIGSTGCAFRGQTEYLADRTGVQEIAMLFIAPTLRVTPVTRHLALRRVAAALRRQDLTTAILLTAEALQRLFRIPTPRLAVVGLNPHAGEGGLFGQEERDLIGPVLARLRVPRVQLDGPLAADAAFFEAARGRYDAVIAMYHDQALIPFKMLARDTGVNLTMGLPFLRTSPDHGTGCDIAPRGMANPGSMMAAMRLAVQCAPRYRTDVGR